MKHQLDMVWGVHAIQELLRAKKRTILGIYTTKPHPIAWKLIEPLLPRTIKISYVSRETLHTMAGTTDHQGIIAYAKPFVYRSKPFDSTKQPFLLLLDSIQDPRNLGAIIRSAYCTGFENIIITEKQSTPLSGTALKAAAGLAEYCMIMRTPSAAAIIPELKKSGYTLYLATLNGENATTVSYKTPLCLVIGNEAIGISSSILSKGISITLPQKTTDISYNASVAAGILMFWISSQNHLFNL